VNPAAQADPFVPQLYRTGEVVRELTDSVTLKIAPLSGTRPDFTPGQFNMLTVFGVGEAAISISGDPVDDTCYIHTVRNVGAVSRALTELKEGTVIGVRGPYGAGWPVNEAEELDVVIVAGGLGLAPVRPAIYKILANRSLYGRVSVLFGSRSPADILYRHELEQWRQRLDVDVQVTVDHADSGWRGNVGVVPGLIARAAFDPHETVAMVCGPEVMMRFSVSALQAAGVPSSRIYLSMERNMKCAIGLCGHCQFGPDFICKDGPVLPFDRIAKIFAMREI
jgi:NAD(P)H-flavin reductase